MAINRYREVALARISENEDLLDVDMDVVFDDGGRAFRRIISKTNPMVWGDVSMDLDAKTFERKVLQEKRVISDYDRKRRLGAVPKPVAPSVPPTPGQPEAMKTEICPKCGNYGYVTDDWGYDELCECRR